MRNYCYSYISGNTCFWKFNTELSSTAPGTISFDNEPDSTSIIYISKNNIDGISKASFVSSMRNPNAADIAQYGTIKLFLKSDINCYVTFKITGYFESANTVELRVIFVNQNLGSFVNGSAIGLTFFPSDSVLDEVYMTLPAWNMDSTANINVTHAIPASTITSIEVSIKSDTGTYLPLTCINTSSVLQGGIQSISDSSITLYRLASGVFDSVNYDGVGSRGSIVIKYLKN
jgi:hypothetical protein